MYEKDSSIKAIAARMTELRTFSDYSTDKMAELLGIEKKTYEEYEKGDKEAPINTIYKFASILDTEPGYVLNGIMPDTDSAYPVYGGNGLSVKRYEGYSFTSLAAMFKHKTMNPMLVTMMPTDAPELVVHGGQEFNYVIEGELRVIVGSKDYFLRAGDSLYFNPSQPHAQLPMNNKPVKFLTVINEL